MSVHISSHIKSPALTIIKQSNMEQLIHTNSTWLEKIGLKCAASDAARAKSICGAPPKVNISSILLSLEKGREGGESGRRLMESEHLAKCRHAGILEEWWDSEKQNRGTCMLLFHSVGALGRVILWRHLAKYGNWRISPSGHDRLRHYCSHVNMSTSIRIGLGLPGLVHNTC